MKNLYNPSVKDEILARIDKLEAGSKALWGKMNVNQGLRHMSMAFDIATGKLTPTLGWGSPDTEVVIKIFPPECKTS